MTTTMQPQITDAFAVLADASEREPWLKARLRGVGASESPILMGASKFSSPIELWGIKTGRLPESIDDENERMLWGQRLEPLVAEEYERKTGRRLVPWGKLLQSKSQSVMLATPDYQIVGQNVPVEIKTTDASRKSDWADGAPLHVNIQCQHQMFVTGARSASVGVLVGGNRFMWCDVERDETLIAEILDTCLKFWQRVTDDVPPPADGLDSTSEAIARLWPITAEGESIVLPADAYDWARELTAAKSEEKQAAGRIAELTNTVKVAMGSAEIGLFPDGEQAFSYRTQKRRGYTVAPGSSRVLRRLANG